MNSNPGPWARGVRVSQPLLSTCCVPDYGLLGEMLTWAPGRELMACSGGVTGLKQSSPCKDMYIPGHSQVFGIEAQPFCLGFITQACLFLNIFFLVIVSIFERLHDKNELIVVWIPMIDFRLLGVTFPAQGGSAVFF